MLERTQELDRDRTSMTRTATRMRDGHRREYDPRQAGERLSFRQRCERALADVGIYRSVSFRDLAEPHFGGHPYTARRAVNRWIRAGMMGEHTAKGPKGKPFKVLTLTQRGAEKARRAARGQGLDRQQRTWAGLVKRSELTHDTEVYRACGFGAPPSGRSRSLHPARPHRLGTQKHRCSPQREAARELGLPVDEQGRVLYPDAQLEYTDADGREGRVNIEVASEHYRDQSILAKSNAGFALHATGAAKTRVLRTLRSGQGEGNDGTTGAAQRDLAALELVRDDATLESQCRSNYHSGRVGGACF